MGFLGVGLSLVLFVLALRHLGTARTGAYFSLAPFIGAVLAVAMLGDPVSMRLGMAAVLMGLGLWMHLLERHDHEHLHEALEHEHAHVHDEHHRHGNDADLPIDEDVILAAPIWHDWAKTIVFQWNSDGSEFTEFNFGGAGVNDAWGAAGDSRTGGHHILSVAESMARGLSPLMVITQASAHSAPTLGNEFKVVNWLRAAAIIARIDPVKGGYLMHDSTGRLRLPALGQLGDVDLLAAGQVNVRTEYTLHNLSDADFTFSGPAISSVNVLLTQLAPEFGYNATDASTFNTRFRNPALSYLSGERLLILYGANGLDSVRQELKRLRQLGVI